MNLWGGKWFASLTIKLTEVHRIVTDNIQDTQKEFRAKFLKKGEVSTKSHQHHLHWIWQCHWLKWNLIMLHLTSIHDWCRESLSNRTRCLWSYMTGVFQGQDICRLVYQKWGWVPDNVPSTDPEDMILPAGPVLTSPSSCCYRPGKSSSCWSNLRIT